MSTILERPFKCAHISDIHFRSLKRHDEYKTVFEDLFKKIRNENLDAIFIGGDIVHSKTQGITPELIDILNWWFTSMAEICPTYVILGNHDGLILNEDRQDAITPIINALNNKNIHLYKKSGVYSLKESKIALPINWCVFSCFDEKNWDIVKPVKNEINIACYHGAISGALTDTDWELEGEVNVNMFDGYDFTFLGDIHKRQYLDKEKRVAYPGSTIQQNYGEDVKKGFLIWEIKSRYDYKSTFVQIKNPNPMITVDWTGELQSMIQLLEPVVDSVKYRIRSRGNLSQADIKILHHYLKNDKNAAEIVYQDLGVEIKSEKVLFSNDTENKNLNIRNKKDRIEIIDSYFSNSTQKQKNELEKYFADKLSNISVTEDKIYNKQWAIKDIKFSNVFAYGKDNYINFDKLNGLVGIFGPNRAGKSSIPGAIMYSLFNTSDRGTLKNKDIVNTRKGGCITTTRIVVDSNLYEVERETVKKTTKKNEVNAVTSLRLKNLTNTEDLDESEEQRRETEKTLRNLIGTSDDFLYTSFASQGEINTFINEKTTARKSVLSKFLNLEVYDELYSMTREDYAILKNGIKNLKEKNWEKEILLAEDVIKSLKEENDNNSSIISKLRKEEVEKRVKLQEIKNKSKQHSSGYDLYTVTQELDNSNERLNRLIQKLENLNKDIENSLLSLEKIDNFKSNFPIEELNEDKERLDSLNDKLKEFNDIVKETKKEEERNKNQIKILQEVPCGDSFPTCKFIKNAHESKDILESKKFKETITEFSSRIFDINNSIQNIKRNNIDEKIKKYNDLLTKEINLNSDLKIKNIEKENVLIKIEKENKEINNFENLMQELKDFNSNDLHSNIEKVKTELKEISDLIYKHESSIHKNMQEIANVNSKIKEYENEKNNFDKIKKDWELFSLFNESISKKGIPTMLINTYLPKINSEINKILSGVTNFKIYLEDDEKNNNLNVFIDYGDSRRVIECASGMEKMMASIAIRVALTNISSLSRSNMFIIDEGFGALDDTNIEACGRLLTSLKNYFKTILIISHVDAIKDIVDKSIDITLKGKDSYVNVE